MTTTWNRSRPLARDARRRPHRRAPGLEPLEGRRLMAGDLTILDVAATGPGAITVQYEVRGEAIYSEIKTHIAAALRGERVTFEGQAEVNGQTYHYQTNYVPDLSPDGQVLGFFSFLGLATWLLL